MVGREQQLEILAGRPFEVLRVRQQRILLALRERLL
jgi:hypothetical protein